MLLLSSSFNYGGFEGKGCEARPTYLWLSCSELVLVLHFILGFWSPRGKHNIKNKKKKKEKKNGPQESKPRSVSPMGHVNNCGVVGQYASAGIQRAPHLSQPFARRRKNSKLEGYLVSEAASLQKEARGLSWACNSRN